MTSYRGRHALLYDIFYADKPYDAEVAFVRHLFDSLSPSPPHRVLDLACGTGSHSVLLARSGLDVTGVDHSGDMLAVAGEKALQSGLDIAFVEQDLQNLDVAGGPFDAAVCLFDSIGYLRTNSALNAALAAVRRHLSDNAIFVLEFWHAFPMIRSFDPIRKRSWRVDDTEIERVSETSLSCEQQVATVRFSVEERRDGVSHSFQETQINRFFLVQEMGEFLSRAGLEPIRWLDGFRDAPVSEDTWHVVGVARAS
jgi:ubiquinone/menaquinone biosynthesis C-methylase UbiE